MRPARKLETAVLSVHGIILDIDVALAGVDALGEPGDAPVIPHLQQRVHLDDVSNIVIQNNIRSPDLKSYTNKS